MKSRLILPLIGIIFAGTTGISVSNSNIEIRFMDNKNQDVSTFSGMEAIGNNLIFDTVTIQKGNKVEKPTTTPVLEGYKFDEWYSDRECSKIFDFSEKLYRNTTIYAGYIRDESAIIEKKYEEVQLSFIEKIDDSISNPVNLTGVLNMPILNSTADISNNGLAKLEANKEDCLKYLNYVRKSNATNLSATYNNKTITFKYTYNLSETTTVINLNLKGYGIDNSTYETKAKKYDNYVIDDYSLILGGSSSMENWSTSKEDLEEFTTTNIGIGGTTVSHWDGLLNERLVYPNNPRGVVYYLGINNIINSKETGTSTGNQLVTMFDHVHEHLPDTTIYFVLINYVPGYMSYKNHITTANDIVKEYSKDKDYMVLIDAGSLLMKSNDLPNWGYFKTDGLHMSLAGYVVWGGKVKQELIKQESELYGTK